MEYVSVHSPEQMEEQSEEDHRLSLAIPNMKFSVVEIYKK